MRNLRAVETTPRAVIYLRQSTYRDESISLELQETACRDYCARNGYDIVGVYADPGISGRTWSKRPRVQETMSVVESGAADVIVLWKWSRLSRSRKDWALAADRVDIAGGRIESATEPIDTATASGRFARGVMTEYAAFQSEQIGETWEEVRQRRLRNGLPASGRLPFGWVWKKGEGIELDPERGPIVVEMYERYLAGEGSASIARWLNEIGIPGPNGKPWTRARPLTVLDSPIHAGLIPYRGATYEGAHAALIDRATRDLYLAERARRNDGRERPQRSAYLASQLMLCSCGSRMHGKGSVTDGRWYGGYLCSVGRTAPDHAGAAYVSAIALHPELERWALTFDISGSRGDLPSAAARSVKERALRELAQLESEAANIIRDRARSAGDAPASSYDRALSLIDADRARVQRELDDAERSLRAVPDETAVHSMRTDWEFWPVERRNQALRRLVARIQLSPDGTAVALFPAWGGRSSVLSLR